MKSRFHRFTFAAALSIAWVAVTHLCSAAALAVERFVGLTFAFLARREPMTPTFGRLAVAGGPAFAYAGPSQHFLRHEAGTARRAADRHT